MLASVVVYEHPGTTAALLAGTDLFAGLPRPALEQVAQAAVLQRLPYRKRIFSQGDRNARIHVLFNGWVRISRTGSNGDNVVVRFIAPGTIFGVLAPFSDGRYRADATVVLDAAEASWSENDLRLLILQYPEIGVNMVRIIGGRLVEMQERARELATQRADRRIANALLRILARTGQKIEDGVTIPFPLRRRDIADITGTTLYTASRILAGWEAAGLSTSQHRLLTIHDCRQLARIAEREDD